MSAKAMADAEHIQARRAIIRATRDSLRAAGVQPFTEEHASYMQEVLAEFERGWDALKNLEEIKKEEF